MKNKGGRPKINIDFLSAEKLANLHCTGEEIAGFLNVDYKTLERAIKREYKLSFGEWYKKHSGKGRISLRRKQYEMAMSGSVTMLIWLGKQHLNQSDKDTVEADNKKSEDIAEALAKAIKGLPGA